MTNTRYCGHYLQRRRRSWLQRLVYRDVYFCTACKKLRKRPRPIAFWYRRASALAN